MKKILLAAFLYFALTSVPAQNMPTATEQPANLTITVNEGIELLSVIQVLSGQLNNSTPSSYKIAMKKYFLPYRTSPAVTTMFMVNNTVYPDFVELGILFYDFPNIKMHLLPDSSFWYTVIPKDSLALYLTQCMQFYKDAKFNSFYQAHTADYTTWATELNKKIAVPVNIFNNFFNSNNKYAWHIYLDPLNDWGAHTIIAEKLLPFAKNTITYQLGDLGGVDSTGNLDFKTNVYDLAWHEGTHAVTDEVLKKYRAKIDSLAYLLKKDDALKKQNITDWTHYFNELVPRAVSIALSRKYRSNADYERLLSFETNRGFPHAKLVSDVIYNNYINQRKVQNFKDVFPLIFNALVDNYK